MLMFCYWLFSITQHVNNSGTKLIQNGYNRIYLGVSYFFNLVNMQQKTNNMTFDKKDVQRIVFSNYFCNSNTYISH